MGPGEGGEGRGEGVVVLPQNLIKSFRRKKKTNMIKVPSSTQQTQESNCKYFVLDGGGKFGKKGEEKTTQETAGERTPVK